MTTRSVPTSLQMFAEQYLQAWQDHDVDGIMALHTPDSVLTSVAVGTDAAGQGAVRQAIIDSFVLWPDLRFHPVHTHISPEMIVGESMAEATQAVPLPLGDVVVEPNGKTIRFPVADIMELEKGLVKRKGIYFDALGYLRQMRTAAAQ